MNNLGALVAAAAAFIFGSSKFAGGQQAKDDGYNWRDKLIPDTSYNPSSSASAGGRVESPPAVTDPRDVFGTPRLTGFTEISIDNPQTGTVASPDSYARPTTTDTTQPSPAAPVGSETKPRWNWFTPGGTVISRDPTEQEKEDGMGCPPVPGIWEYPAKSASDLRYCSNPDCPAIQTVSDMTGAVIPGERAILYDQGADSPSGKRWFCIVCRTYQG